MTLSVNWLIEKANRKLNAPGMDKDVADITRAVIKELAPKGIYVGVAQGYRSKAEQDALYAQGRTKPGPIVTGARGGQSNHNFGVAVDLFVYSDDGTKSNFYSPGNSKLSAIVAAMKKRGMEWGGDWKGFPDYPHYQLYDAAGGKKKPSVSKAPVSKPASKPTPKPAAKPQGDGKAIVPYPGKPLYIGAKGMAKKDIERIQRAVGASVTGKYDKQTADKVGAYQKRKKLEADKVVGLATWNTLF
ncbi:hypothetical protein ADM98_11375 [Exiguobacterium sp. BMC-KP]|uniref:M15 family metallopeptidase n=1 Tax=Exiguobacterium sp. BMC-KP TaxID=1684312 RepID=UPI0006AA2F0A|nr:M15 family metallopeptidase [Exiguobacterium sp. BMC-KP]KOP29470.1 hypothetical protein ADM98_11375 [Exiguobacterium sp. BMC-KP]